MPNLPRGAEYLRDGDSYVRVPPRLCMHLGVSMRVQPGMARPLVPGVLEG